jgi:hypothetical protein
VIQENLTPRSDRTFKGEAKRSWERIGYDVGGTPGVRYTMIDSTIGHTAYQMMYFTYGVPRQWIARELRRMRYQLRQLVREGYKP